jgi:hypothetical protein
LSSYGREPHGIRRHWSRKLLDTLLPGFERDLQEMQKSLEATPEGTFAGPEPPLPPREVLAIVAGEQKYTRLSVPTLAIYAVERALGPTASPAAQARFDESIEVQAKAFEDGVPMARVVRLPHADHYVFRSNEADVLREGRVYPIPGFLIRARRAASGSIERTADVEFNQDGCEAGWSGGSGRDTCLVRRNRSICRSQHLVPLQQADVRN